MKEVLVQVYDFGRRSLEFAQNDFKKRYAGSVLGTMWAYIQTIVMVSIYWLVFQYGLHVGGVDGLPFLPWFICGLMPWFLFSDIINGSINCMYEYSYVVKKVVFNINIIPVARIMTCLFVDSFFAVLIVLIAWLHNIFTGMYILWFLYYLLALIMFAMPLAFLVSVVSVFFKDFAQLVTIALNVLMWATPILWNISVVPEKLRIVFKLNPMYYVIVGVRDSVLYGGSNCNSVAYTVYFWVVVCAVWFLCIRLYNKLLPHLADVI